MKELLLSRDLALDLLHQLDSSLSSDTHTRARIHPRAGGPAIFGSEDEHADESALQHDVSASDELEFAGALSHHHLQVHVAWFAACNRKFFFRRGCIYARN